MIHIINNREDNNNSDWVKRNVADEPRLSELVEMYESLGFEVETREFNPADFPEKCNECLTAFPEKYKVIFTRKKRN